jgi:hypothetical protein
MIHSVSFGREAVPGIYHCARCGYELKVIPHSFPRMPPCPSCVNGTWHRPTTQKPQVAEGEGFEPSLRL